MFVTSETTHRRQKQQYTKNGSRVRSAALDGLETKSTVCVALKKKEEFWQSDRMLSVSVSDSTKHHTSEDMRDSVFELVIDWLSLFCYYWKVYCSVMVTVSAVDFSWVFTLFCLECISGHWVKTLRDVLGFFFFVLFYFSISPNKPFLWNKITPHLPCAWRVHLNLDAAKGAQLCTCKSKLCAKGVFL